MSLALCARVSDGSNHKAFLCVHVRVCDASQLVAQGQIAVCMLLIFRQHHTPGTPFYYMPHISCKRHVFKSALFVFSLSLFFFIWLRRTRPTPTFLWWLLLFNCKYFQYSSVQHAGGLSLRVCVCVYPTLHSSWFSACFNDVHVRRWLFTCVIRPPQGRAACVSQKYSPHMQCVAWRQAHSSKG